MKRITERNFRSDSYYRRVVEAVTKIFETGHVVRPIDVFMNMRLLSRENLERWYKGQVRCLEDVIGCSPAHAGRILRVLNKHAQQSNLRPSTTGYKQWGGKRRPLKFTKWGDPNIEAAYARHFLHPHLKKGGIIEIPSKDATEQQGSTQDSSAVE